MPYFETKCHFVLSNVTVRAKTIFLAQRRPALLILRHESKIVFGQVSVLSDISCFAVASFEAYVGNRKPQNIYQELWAATTELHFIISRSVYCQVEFCG